MTKRRTDPDIVHRIDELADAGYTGAAIERLLSADPDYADRLPSVRTIQSIVIETTKDDEPIWWSVTDATLDEARAVLPVLRYRAEHLRSLDPEYRKASLRIAKDLAGWIAKVRGIAPALAPDEAYKLALRYWMKPSPELDEELARHLEGAGQGTDIDGPDGVAEV